MSSLKFLNETREPSALIPFADRLEVQLTDYGKYNLLAVALRITPPEGACEVLDSALRSLSAGQPGAAFQSYADEAKDWCSLASLPERKCYIAAIWQSLPHEEQSAFWGYVQGRAAA